MRAMVMGLTVVALAGCQPRVPDSAAGVGFDSYGTYALQREETLQGMAGADPVTVAPLDVTGSLPMVENPLDQEDGAAQDTAALDPAYEGDEQLFALPDGTLAVAAPRADRPPEQVAVTPVQPRRGADGPNVVQFALTTTNNVGEPRYRRINPLATTLNMRNCGRYPSADKAQEAFLKAGGPERDRLGLDPDGDGFACGWDPAPFRQVLSGGQ